MTYKILVKVILILVKVILIPYSCYVLFCRDLFQWDAAREKATTCYNKSKVEMHSITATMVGKDLEKALAAK